MGGGVTLYLLALMFLKTRDHVCISIYYKCVATDVSSDWIGVSAVEVKATGSGKICLAKEEGSITLSIDFMSAAARVIMAAAKAERANMVAYAFTPSTPKYSCPSWHVRSPDTTWFVDKSSITEYNKRKV